MRNPSGERVIRIASRGSELALWQAHAVRDALVDAQPELRVSIDVVRTTGDRVLDVPLAQIGDRGLFTKEIDEALLEGRADLAVHSLKDVPTRLPDGLELAAITEREDPRDVLILPLGQPGGLRGVPDGARIGTSSLRRRAQLRAVRPGLEVVDLRGNLNTRLAKLDEGAYDGILLAAAGVLRLGWGARISDWLDPPEWLPAVGQGALAVVTREGDERVGPALQALHHPETAAAVAAERAFLRSLEGGCQIPIAALGRVEEDSVVLDGLVADLDGTILLRDCLRGEIGSAAAVGRALAGALRERGADDVLNEIRRRAGAPPVPGP